MAAAQPLLHNMVIAILVSLPVKSLIRFRCTSKHWCTLIRSPNFVCNHLLKPNRNNIVLLVRRCLPPPQEDDVLSFHNLESSKLVEARPNISIPFLNDLNLTNNQPYCQQNVFLLGPCIGLVCLIHDTCVSFCNPALREFKQLPTCPFSCPQDFYERLLAKGFGNTQTKTFKVVLIKSINPDDYYADESHNETHLYDSSTNSWRKIDENGIVMPYITSLADVFFNGACHWNGATGSPGISDVVITFDIGTEVFGQIEYPDCLKVQDGNQTDVIILNECLGLVRYHQWMTEPHLIEGWSMKQYGIKESWTKQFVIGPHLVICPLSCWKDWLFVEGGDGQLVSCAIPTNHVENINVYGVEETLKALIYTESLIKLNEIL